MSWTSIFDMFREAGDDDDWRLAKRIAPDFDVAGPRTVILWLKRGAIPMQHWRRLILIAAQRFSVLLSADQLLDATLAVRDTRAPKKQQEAA